jgi:hypothetical protein
MESGVAGGDGEVAVDGEEARQAKGRVVGGEEEEMSKDRDAGDKESVSSTTIDSQNAF